MPGYDLKTALKRVTTKPSNFVLIKGTKGEQVVISPQPPSAQILTPVMEECGQGKRIGAGICLLENKQLVFATKAAPAPAWAAMVTKVFKSHQCGQYLPAAWRQLGEKESEEASGEDATSGETGGRTGTAETGGTTTATADPMTLFTKRFEVIVPKIKEAIAAGRPNADGIKVKASEAGYFAKKKNFVEANRLLDQAEVLLKGSETPPSTAPKKTEEKETAEEAAAEKAAAEKAAAEKAAAEKAAAEKAAAEKAAAEKVAEEKAAALADAKKKYEEAKLALENGDLKRVPATAPVGLDSEHGAIATAQSALPADPKTIDDYLAASVALTTLTTKVADYLKAAAKKKNVEGGASNFGSTGAKLSELTGHEKLNALQKQILDKALRKALSASDTELSEAEIKAKAQAIVEKTNKLAEVDEALEQAIPGLSEKLAKSETLKNNVIKLKKKGWLIIKNPAGGSYCDKHNVTIAMDPNDTLEDSLGGLAHETGHAHYSPPPTPTVGSSTNGIDYVRQCVEANFIDEGEAQLVACRVVKDLAAVNETANVPADSGDFMAIYEQLLAGTITEDAARKEMAKGFGDLITSTTGESYLVYYGKAAINDWNIAHPPPPPHLDESILTSMTLFA